MLTFAGVDLSPLTPALSDICDRWWIKEAPALWDWPGYEMDRFHHLPIPPKPSKEPAPLNTLVWPSGASRWATFHSLVGGTQATAIENAVDVFSPTPADLVISDPDNGETVTTSMFLVGFRPVFVQESAQQLWLITLVDERYWWWMNDLSFSFTAGDAWDTLLYNLAAATNTGGAITVGSVSTAYGTPSPARWGIAGRPIPLLIDAAAKTVGMRFIRNLDGSVRYIGYANSESLEQNRFTQNQSELVMGGRLNVLEITGNIPASVITSFWGDNQLRLTTTLASLALSPYGAITGVANTYGWIAADMNADAPGGDQALYAAQAAQDFYLWRLSTTDATFRGIRNFDPTGQENRIEWEYQPGRSSRTETEPLQGPTNQVMPWERVLTRIVKEDWGDGNIYGDRPPPGYVYAVRLTEQMPVSSGTGSGSGSGSGSGNSCRPWRGVIRIVDNGQIVDGPPIGFALPENEYPLIPDCTCTTPTVGTLGIAIPDPLVPYRWTFVPACNAGSSSGSSGSSGSSSSSDLTLYKTDCISGINFRFRSTLTISNGQISQSPWVFDSFQGCCSCSSASGGSGPGSATGSNSTSGVVVACATNPIPSRLVATFSGCTGAYACLEGLVIPLEYDPVSNSWKGCVNTTSGCGVAGGSSCNWTTVAMQCLSPGIVETNIRGSDSCAAAFALPGSWVSSPFTELPFITTRTQAPHMTTFCGAFGASSSFTLTITE